MQQELIPSEPNVRYVPAERLAVVSEPRLSAFPPGFGPPQEPDPETSTAPLSHYLWILRRQRWRMLAFVVAIMIATWFLSQRLTPVYESTVTIDIDRQTPQGVIGAESTRSMLNDADQFIATQIRLVQSDSVLRPVAAKYNLLAHEGQTDVNPDAPVQLKRLKIARPPNTYLLLVSYRSPDAVLAAQVANATAQSYLAHTYNIRMRASSNLTDFMEQQLDELRAKMERSSLALNRFERELNMINPEEKTNILSARLLQLNTEYTNAQADRVKKEAAFQSIKNNTLEAAQVSTQGEALKRLTERLGELREKFAEIKSHYGPAHPEYKRASAQLAELERQLETGQRNISGRVEVEYRESTRREQMLLNEVAGSKNEFDRINSKSFQYQSLKREADADKRLYEELVRKIKEAGINAGFQNSNIRVADTARPPQKPVFPDVRLNLLVAFLLSTIVAVGVAVASDALDTTVRDPEQVSRTLGTEVIGSLPVVKNWRGRLGLASGSANASANGKTLVPVKQREEETTGFGESIRTLRTSILLGDLDRRYRSLLVTSASPGEGKSTTAAHLAIAHAEQGQRTLLIDGDMRRPSVHRRFNLPANLGLTNVLLGEVGWRNAVVNLDSTPMLDILPAGPPSRRASDLVGRGLSEVLEEAGRAYDLIILDAPPLLGFSEPLQMASSVDGVVIVVRAGETDRKNVRGVVTSLKRLRSNIVGVVLNGVHKEMSDSYYYYGHYSKYYQQKQDTVQ
jgi:succinoglycan biosynthesis transport protein ExoP